MVRALVFSFLTPIQPRLDNATDRPPSFRRCRRQSLVLVGVLSPPIPATHSISVDRGTAVEIVRKLVGNGLLVGKHWGRRAYAVVSRLARVRATQTEGNVLQPRHKGTREKGYSTSLIFPAG